MDNLTLFGKAMRKLRIDKGITQGDLAEVIGIGGAMLSAVERGDRKMKPEILEKIIKYYELNDSKAAVLQADLADSEESVVIYTKNKPHTEVEMVAMFARRFSSMSDDARHKIEAIIKEKE